MNIEFASKLPTRLPTKARVYALNAPKVSATQLRALAARLEPKAKPHEMIAGDRLLGASVGRWQVEAHKASGAWMALHRDRYGIDEGGEFDLDDRAAAAAARRYAKSLDLLGDGRSSGDFELLAVTHLRTAGADLADKREAPRLLDAGVLFGRRIDGLPVFGPGGQAMVHLAAGGELVGARRVWRPLGRGIATVKVQSVAWATERLAEHLKRTMQGDVKVLKSQFGYLEFGALDRQTSIEPVFAFTYTVQLGEVRSKHVHVLPASGEAHGRLTGSRRFPAARQPKRRGD